MLSQYMRELGYYATNNYKTDYQFQAPKSAWDESGPYAHWRNRSADQPFYSVVNFTTTHESGLFEPYGFREIESRHYFADDPARIAKLSMSPNDKSNEADTPIHVSKDLDFPIPPYLPDTPLVRRDLWKMYNNLAEADRQIGAVLAQLEQDGLLDNTIIFFYSDHGGPLPRQKRLIYDSGLKVPLIIRFPHAQQAGKVDDQLVSFIDFAPTTLKLAGMPTPEHMHGQDFIQNGLQQRDYIHAAADRFDGFTDVIRAVKNKRFKYIRNYRPQQAYYLPVAYRERIPTMQELLRLRNEEMLTPAQAQWFRESKDAEELFDTHNDPHELNNLASDPTYTDELNALRAEMDRWLKAVDDNPKLTEKALVRKLWQGSETQPVTAVPKITLEQGKVLLSSQTSGATISYKLVQENYEPRSWQVYKGPFEAPKGSKLMVVAQRIGFRESQPINKIINY
jgi:arylsulfatase A-like enzyme